MRGTIGYLRAIVTPDSDSEGGYFIQGLELDYAAAGETLEKAKSNFERGLAATMEENRKQRGSLRKVWCAAGPAEWVRLENGVAKRETKLLNDILPFGGIVYLNIE